MSLIHTGRTLLGKTIHVFTTALCNLVWGKVTISLPHWFRLAGMHNVTLPVWTALAKSYQEKHLTRQKMFPGEHLSKLRALLHCCRDTAKVGVRSRQNCPVKTTCQTTNSQNHFLFLWTRRLWAVKAQKWSPNEVPLSAIRPPGVGGARLPAAPHADRRAARHSTYQLLTSGKSWSEQSSAEREQQIQQDTDIFQVSADFQSFLSPRTVTLAGFLGNSVGKESTTSSNLCLAVAHTSLWALY